MSINIAELERFLKSGNAVTVIDVRNEEEYKEKHIPFAINLPVEKLMVNENEFNMAIPIVTVCGKGGGRSEKAAHFLRTKYTTPVYFLEEGTDGWFKSHR